MKKQIGMVLLVTFLLLGCVGFLMMLEMKALLLALHAYHHTLTAIKGREKLEQSANHALKNTSCQGPEKGDNAVLLALEQGRGCHHLDESEIYSYWVEDLGKFPCLQTIWKGKVYSTMHKRVTVMHQHDVLQLRYAMPTTLALCAGSKRLIPLGRLSYRILKWPFELDKGGLRNERKVG